MSFYKTITFLSLSSAGAFVVYYIGKCLWNKYKFRHIPGPPAHGVLGFLLGNIANIKDKLDRGEVFYQIAWEWMETYGDTIKIQYFNEFLIFTRNNKAVKDILIINDFEKNPLTYNQMAYPAGERFLGHGLVTELDKEKWRNRRAIYNVGFSRNSLMNFMNEFNLKGDILLDRLRTLADSNTQVVLLNELNRTTLDVIASIAFGMNLDSINEPNNKLFTCISKSFQGLNKLFTDPFLRFLPSGRRYLSELKQNIRQVRKIGQEQIENRLKALSEGYTNFDDLLNHFLELKASRDEKFDMNLALDEFITFFIAGQETTANLLAFCFLSLGQNPLVLKRLRDELDSVLGSRLDIHYEDLNALKYTTCVLKETLRVYPPVAVIHRKVQKGFQINDWELPEGTGVIISPYLSGRSEENFPDALKFDPDRFLDIDKHFENQHNYGYLPFSLGSRNCIGQNFALMEAKVILAKLVKSFEFVLDPTQNFAVRQETTLMPFDGTRCTISPRSD